MNDVAKEILAQNILGAIATVNDDGSPWVSPIHIVSDERAVYWFSHETTQHSQNIARDARVSVTLFSPDVSSGPKGVYVQGVANKLSVDDTARAKELLKAKIGMIPPSFIEMTGYSLAIGECSLEKSKGNCWYFYT